ncbi:MAG: DUF1800 domain-containing protein [Alphaproteobacteria bacterium]|nr:DUF1800 domain-containing protein [Alphaproteobacteria bacterium]
MLAKRYQGILAALWLLITVPALPAAAADSDAQVLHVLNRLAFGPNADDFAYVKMIGVERYIAEQLDPAAITEPIELRFRLAQLTTFGLGAVALRQFYGPPRNVDGAKPTLDDIKAQQQRANLVFREAAEARVLRAVLSRRQLEQVMVNFWFNHFNIFGGEGLERIWVGDYEDQVIRAFALGRFRDLLFAVAKHPAMLVYLDNTQNIAVARTGQDRLNENFAREVMELHTLGVDGGYSQDDVETLARVFTGWRVNSPGSTEFPEVAAVFQGGRHDSAPKVFLGRKLVARGKAEGEQALDILASSPATAHHIAFGLSQYFVADAPPATLVERVAARFLATGGDIRQVLKTLFDSPEFWSSKGQKYKTPYEFIISAVRASALPLNNPGSLLGWMSRFGMPLYGCLTPEGYKNTADAWLSPDATLQRIDFAAAFARGGVPVAMETDGGRAVASPSRPLAVEPSRLLAIFGPSLSPETRAVVDGAPPGQRAGLILGSPDFMRR